MRPICAALIAAPALLLASILPARAQTDLTIAATGQVEVPPDEASADFTVQAQYATAAQAQAAVNTACAKALALAQAVPGVQAVTGGYSSYTVTNNNAPAQFSAQQDLQLTIPAKDGIPPAAFAKLLGTLQQDGLLLNSLSGDLSDAGQRRAAQAAIADALAQIQGQAGAIAASLHEQVGEIKSLNVNAAPEPQPRPMMAMAMSAGAPAPQSVPDNVQISASVTADIALTKAP